ncbi:hypothetical protein M3Y94_00577300 [Aphelenchoides besseyi]|nr:hypothetical protein M3Y94_00577300 [Aphelenchoides besseyi]KAI6221990.1 hypothetical protein M3Y95_00937300 [Aphelenchoides besseyi]
MSISLDVHPFGCLKWNTRSILLFVFFIISSCLSSAERCPPILGEIECPLRYKCELNVCKDERGLIAPSDCAQITCGPDARCASGSCYPVEGLPCGRNVLVAENTARSITSSCGRRGRCINGRCAIDKCAEVLCEQGEICRDGKCIKMLGAFCFTLFDCGIEPGMECRGNRCTREASGAEAEGMAKIDCDPGHVALGNDCVKQRGCEEIVCDPGFSCMNGVCLPMNGADCSQTQCPEGLICKRNVCVADPCRNHCPKEHACMNGECRHIQGMFCQDDECEDPYVCLNGQCVRNECARKVCQLGERCENGICIRVEGNLCSSALRDCGEAFDCVKSMCRDKIHAVSGATNSDSAA